MIRTGAIAHEIDGYGSSFHDPALLATSPDVTTEHYGHDQREKNSRITREYLEPLCERTASRVVLDVGCGVGKSVMTLLEDGYDAYGVDLAALTRHWAADACPPDRFFVVPPLELALPFEDESIDLAFSFGVLEHLGTADGGATRRADYHRIRQQWLREVFRVVRPGGYLLMGGPNRNFPFDLSHGLDAGASSSERWLSRIVGASVHRTWGEYFLWGYRDFDRYLEGLQYELTPLSIRGLLQFGRVPKALRPAVRLYVEHLPRPLLGTGFNPWVMALVRRLA
jgi:SAM-dependent methyltransferase